MLLTRINRKEFMSLPLFHIFPVRLFPRPDLIPLFFLFAFRGRIAASVSSVLPPALPRPAHCHPPPRSPRLGDRLPLDTAPRLPTTAPDCRGDVHGRSSLAPAAPSKGRDRRVSRFIPAPEAVEKGNKLSEFVHSHPSPLFLGASHFLPFPLRPPIGNAPRHSLCSVVKSRWIVESVSPRLRDTAGLRSHPRPRASPRKPRRSRRRMDDEGEC